MGLTRVLVTGASGFVGRHLCDELIRRGHTVRAALRRPDATPVNRLETCIVGELSPGTDWTRSLEGVDHVVHLAAKAHVLDQRRDDGEYFRINAATTEGLARAAARAGVRRIVLMSSIKVYGDGRPQAFSATETPHPVDVYGQSKLAAENLLLDATAGSVCEAVAIRPPLVYGPGVRANFLRLMQWVERGVPLPLGAVRNSRSVIALGNLSDFVAHVLAHAGPVRGTWLVSDGEDVSTPELIRRIAKAMQRTPRLVAVPLPLLRLAASLLGKGADFARLCNSLTLDIGATRRELGWAPPVAQQVAIDETVQWHLRQAGAR
jgi:nucleoside-diphosphate-sugar epimerase